MKYTRNEMPLKAHQGSSRIYLITVVFCNRFGTEWRRIRFLTKIDQIIFLDSFLMDFHLIYS